MINKFEKIFSQYFTKNTHLILGLSGGPDSVCLGELLYKISCTKVTVAHFNHGWRGEESDKDQEFCEKFAKKWKFEFVAENWDVPVKSEEKARNARMKYFQKLLKKKAAKGILLAHHQDDSIETAFFNYLRGSGIKGLAGIELFNSQSKVFRPLLQFSKKEILIYLKKNKLEYRLDKTNQNNKYARNFIRNELFPLIESKFPHFRNSTSRASAIFSDLAEYLNHEAEKWIKKNQGTSGKFDKKKFTHSPIALKNEIIKTLWKPKNLDFDQNNKLIEFIEQGASGKIISINGVNLKLYGNNFFIENKNHRP